MEIKLGKLSNPKSNADLKKEATFGKLEAKPNLEPNYTFNKANNQKIIIILKFGVLEVTSYIVTYFMHK
jgi:hypothetical protein